MDGTPLLCIFVICLTEEQIPFSSKQLFPLNCDLLEAALVFTGAHWAEIINFVESLKEAIPHQYF